MVVVVAVRSWSWWKVKVVVTHVGVSPELTWRTPDLAWSQWLVVVVVADMVIVSCLSLIHISEPTRPY